MTNNETPIERALRLKAQRDAYTRAGFTLEDAMRLIEAELSRPPQPLQAPAWDPDDGPFRITCSHAPVVDALVEAAGGIRYNGTSQAMIAGVIIPSA